MVWQIFFSTFVTSNIFCSLSIELKLKEIFSIKYFTSYPDIGKNLNIARSRVWILICKYYKTIGNEYKWSKEPQIYFGLFHYGHNLDKYKNT